MRKIVVLTFLSMDGIMQAPGGKGEDPSNGFNLEGWTVPYFDEALDAEMGRQLDQPFELLLGRKTYDVFAAYWPQQGPDNLFNRARKYLVSNRAASATWENTVVVNGDAAAEIRKLKAQDGPMLQVHGSGELIQLLLAHDLVDELWLKIFPVTLGRGKRLFGAGTIPAAFTLNPSSKVLPNGVIIASYTRAGQVQQGSF